MNPIRAVRRSGAILAAALTLSIASPQASAMQLYIEPQASLATTEPSWSFIRLQLDVEPSDSIENIKAKIFDLNATFQVDRQVLYFADQLLDESRTLADYNVGKNQILTLTALPAPSAPAAPAAQTVPEPSTGWLVLASAVGIALTRALRSRRG